MKCIICGKELTGKKMKYCSMECAKKAYVLGLSETKANTEVQIRSMWNDFNKAFDVSEKITATNAWKMRVFVEACYIQHHTPNSIARALKKDHATILHHKKKVQEKERLLAVQFLKDPKNYKYGKVGKPVYPVGFHY